jgi:hypothetical protein
VSSFSDDFENGVTGQIWDARSWTNPYCAYVEQGGQLRFNHSGEAWEGCGAVLAHGYDLTGDSITVEVPSISDEDDFWTWLSLGHSDGYYAEIEVYQGQIRSLYAINHNEFLMASVPYDPAVHRWWRMREQAGQMLWQTSPDGTIWSTAVQLPNPFPVTALDVELGVGCGSQCATPPSASFDNYNLPP